MMNDLLRIPIAAHGRWVVFTSMALAFLMPLWQPLLPVFLVLLLISWWRAPGVRPVIHEKWLTVLPWILLLYVLHLIGMAWSTNMDYGLFDLQIKLPLLLLPMLAFLKPRATSDLLVPVLLSFAVGNALAVIAGSVHVAIMSTAPDASLARLISGPGFSFLLHPSYFSLHLLFALAGMLFTPLYERLPRWTVVLLLVFLVAGVVLSGSKIGWMLLPVLLIMILFVQWKVGWLRRSIVSIAVIGMSGLIALVVLSPFAKDRVQEMVKVILGTHEHAGEFTSSEIRKRAWESAWELGKNNLPWGTGTGDVKDDLMTIYQQKGYHHLLEHRINPHSQYLQMFAALGVPGMVLIVVALMVPLVHSIMRRHLLLIAFLVLCALNFAVESMLEVQAGVMFFSFFAFLLSQTSTDLRPHDPLQPTAHR